MLATRGVSPHGLGFGQLVLRLILGLLGANEILYSEIPVAL